MRRTLVVLGAGLLLASNAACHSESSVEKTAHTRSRQTRDAARKAGLSKAAADVLARYAGASGEQFSITYNVAGSGANTLVLEQDPPRKRVDVVGNENGQSVTRSEFQLSNGQFSCVLAEAQWTCARADQPQPALGVLGADDVKRTVNTLEQSLGSFDFKVEKRTMIGVQATCLDSVPRPGTPPGTLAATLCISPEGAPLYVQAGGNPLVAVRYSSHVDTRRFALPASIG